MEKSYIELIGTIIATPMHKKKLQIIIGQSHDIINDTHQISCHDIITLHVQHTEHYRTGDTVHIKGSVTLNTTSLDVYTQEIKKVEKGG